MKDSNCEITIKVINVNDAPVFTGCPVEAGIKQDAPEGQSVTAISAYDEDAEISTTDSMVRCSLCLLHTFVPLSPCICTPLS